jgi:hypothetical protein
MGVRPDLSIRGDAAAMRAARRLGARVRPGAVASLVRPTPALLVIDDPSAGAASPWLRAARRAGVPVASVHDLGIAPLASDLAIDGSLGARRVAGLGRHRAACCLGPRYAILDPGLARPAARRAAPPTVVVGLGGGRHALNGIAVARALDTALAGQKGPIRARVLLSLGLASENAAARRRVPPGVVVLDPAQFRDALAAATVAVVGGGTTLYATCALGTAAVATAVVPGQRPTVRRFARAGLAVAPVAGAVGSPRWAGGLAAAALALLDDGVARAALARRAALTIDGSGAGRAARELLRLARGAATGRG